MLEAFFFLSHIPLLTYHSVEYKRVKCPKELTDVSKCTRTDDATFEKEANSTSTSAAAAGIQFSSAILATLSLLVTGTWLILI